MQIMCNHQVEHRVSNSVTPKMDIHVHINHRDIMQRHEKSSYPSQLATQNACLMYASSVYEMKFST